MHHYSKFLTLLKEWDSEAQKLKESDPSGSTTLKACEQQLNHLLLAIAREELDEIVEFHRKDSGISPVSA